MHDVSVFDSDDLSPAQRSAIVELCNAAHGTDAFDEMFVVYFVAGARHVVAHHDGAIVSHAVVSTRWVRPDGHEPLRTAFVDAVATSPSLEGRGFGSAALRTLAASIDDFEVGCLQTDIPRFYERLGWELWRGPLSGRAADGAVVATPHQQGVMVLRLPHTPALDLDAGLSIEWQPDRFWE